ncbi:MAG TPA: hypothetical protein VF432_07475 [Thermoanaerobaculia bacterium]
MRKATAAILLTLAFTASAETTLAFRVTLTDGRTALLANPKVDELKLSDELLQRAASNRVLLLDHTSGTRWNWLMLSWLETHPDAEYGLNAAGVAAIGKGADIGVTPIDQHTYRVRCLHERCEVTVARGDEKQTTATLKNGQSRNVAYGSDLRVAF